MSDAPRSFVRRFFTKALARDLAIAAVVLAGLHYYRVRDLPHGPAPRIERRALDGRSVTVPSNEATVVHFFATWCGTCRVEEPNLVALAESGNVVFVASHSGMAAQVRAYASAHGLTMPIVVDDGSLMRAYGVNAFPTTFFVDDDGEIDFVEVGYTSTLGLRARLALTR